jgi:hypothetical protein
MMLLNANEKTVQLGEYMTAVDRTPADRKTFYFDVLDRHGGVLGAIQWYGAWRQYCFFPDSSTAPVFNPDCLERIAAFAALCTRQQRSKAAARTSAGQEKE